jgi:hypothetical protein
MCRTRSSCHRTGLRFCLYSSVGAPVRASSHPAAATSRAFTSMSSTAKYSRGITSGVLTCGGCSIQRRWWSIDPRRRPRQPPAPAPAPAPLTSLLHRSPLSCTAHLSPAPLTSLLHRSPLSCTAHLSPAAPPPTGGCRSCPRFTNWGSSREAGARMRYRVTYKR